MSTASERIPLVGLTLADAHKIQQELARRSSDLRQQECDWTSTLQKAGTNENAVSACEAIISSIRYERRGVLAAREALGAAVSATLNGLG